VLETTLAACAYFVFVFFKAFQQRNVAFMHYRWIMPISYAMSLTEVLVISIVAMKATNGFTMELLYIGLGIGTGGGLGAIVAMYLHDKHVSQARTQ